MNQILYDFRKDLRSGLTIEDACRKYGVTFKYVMENMERPYTKNRKIPKRDRKGQSTKVSDYIYRICNSFSIIKSLNSRSQNFGTYTTLDDAERVRDYFLENGWDRRKLDTVCDDLKIIRR